MVEIFLRREQTTDEGQVAAVRPLLFGLCRRSPRSPRMPGHEARPLPLLFPRSIQPLVHGSSESCRAGVPRLEVESRKGTPPLPCCRSTHGPCLGIDRFAGPSASRLPSRSAGTRVPARCRRTCSPSHLARCSHRTQSSDRTVWQRTIGALVSRRRTPPSVRITLS